MSEPRKSLPGKIVRICRPLFESTFRSRTLFGLTLLMTLMLTLNGLNVTNSFVGRDFMSSIANRDTHRYAMAALMYVMVFAISTIVTVMQSYTQDRISLYWRSSLTTFVVSRYMSNHAYYHLNSRKDVDNPDQRISQDIKTFCGTLLSVIVMALNSTITVLAFAGILWSIHPILFVVAVGYAAFGSIMTMLIGQRLVGLDNLQLKKEGDLRYELIHTRESAAAIAVGNCEAQAKNRIRARIEDVVGNYRLVISAVRNIGFFTAGFKYFVPFIPVVIVAPRYLRGEVEFGSVTQAAMAFAQVVDAASLIVLQFQNLSEFAAVINRLQHLLDSIDTVKQGGIEAIVDNTRIQYERLTLRAPSDDRVLVANLTLTIPRKTRVLIVGTNGMGKSALLRATIGIWENGEGRIRRPVRDQLYFLPPKPYTTHGTVREQLQECDTENEAEISTLLDALHKVHFHHGGQKVELPSLLQLPVEELSDDDQQTFAIARLLIANPDFVLLDHSLSSLEESHVRRIYDVLEESSITYLSIAENNSLERYHNLVLEIRDDASWSVRPAGISTRS